MSMPKLARTLASLDLVGGNVSLDFANTINSRMSPEHDYLGSYHDLAAWCELAGVVSPEGTSASGEEAAGNPQGTEPVLRRALRLRESIYRTFSTIAAGHAPAAADVRLVLDAYGRAVMRGSLELDPHGTGLRWKVDAARSDLLDPIAYAAGHLLLAADHPPVKECPGCGWLFVDRSRNGSRRWCDMQVCGSRDKMRRFYRSRRPSQQPRAKP